MLKKIFQHCGLDQLKKEENFPENFFPVPNKYIIYQTGSEKKSQIYDYSPEVLSIISKELSLLNIEIVQVGDLSDPLVPNSIDLRSQLTIRQLAYLIKNSKLCITSNILTAKLCRVYKKDLILLGSNFPSKMIKPDFDEVLYIEPELKTAKWNYKQEEWPKNINHIKPEIVAKAILQKLGISNAINYKTLYIGDKYGPRFLNFIPDNIFPKELASNVFNFRLDIVNNPQYLPYASKVSQIDITTKTSFDLSKLNIANIKSIIYFCDKDIDINFVKECISKLINIGIICEDEEALNEVRFKCLGICTVYKKIKEKPLDILETRDTFFKCNRVYISNNKTYASIYHYKNDLELTSSVVKLDDSFINDKDFLENKDYTLIFKNESQ
jgi:hypothetical protein